MPLIERREEVGMRDDPFMWVRVADWMLLENEPPRPDAGSVLRGVGVRLRGVVTAANNATPDGVVEVNEADEARAHLSMYSLTGIASDAEDVSTNITRSRWRRGSNEHSGVEFVLTVGPARFLVSCDGRAADVVTGSRLTATGRLALIGEYEWEGFELTDTRADWLVTEVVDLPDGDTKLALTHPALG